LSGPMAASEMSAPEVSAPAMRMSGRSFARLPSAQAN
jgi:hypothetical protein